MAHNAKVWPGGLTNNVSNVDHTELEALDANGASAVNGDDGGTWAPAAPIVIAGAGMTVKLTDFATWPTAKTRNLMQSFANAYKAVSIAPNSQGYQQASGTGAVLDVELHESLHDGATLSTLTLYFKIPVAHVGLPAVFPKICVARVDVTTMGVGVSLNSTDPGLAGTAISTAGTVAAYEAGGAVQTFVFTLDQNNVIDRSKYKYLFTLVDENGANALSGNTFGGAKIALTAIADARFQ